MSDSAPKPDPESDGSLPKGASTTGRTHEPKSRKKRRWRRVLLVGVVCILATAVVARVIIAIAFPYVLRKAAAACNLDASYSRMKLYSLSGDLGLWDLTVRDNAGGAPVMTTEYARVDVSVLSLLKGELVVQRAELDGMRLEIRREADGRIPALENLLAGGDETPESDERETQLSLASPLRADAVRINRLRAHWVDRSVNPIVDTELELTLRLSDVGASDRPARLFLEGTGPPLLDTLRVEGTAEARPRRLDAKLSFLMQGLHPKPAAGYLAPTGIRPVGNSIALRGAMEIKISAADSAGSGATTTKPSSRLAGTVTIADVSAEVDGKEAAGVDRMVVSIDALSGTAAQLSKVTIDGVRANASRTAEGRIRFAGLEFTAPAAPERPMLAASAPAANTAPQAKDRNSSPMALALKQLTLQRVRVAFRDEGVMPAADLALIADELAVTGIDSARRDGVAEIVGTLSSPRLAESIRLHGTIQPFAATRTLDAKLVVRGIRPDAIHGYLDALHLEPTFENGTLTCDLRAAVAVASDGTIRADASLRNVSVTDGAAELLALDAVGISGFSLERIGSRLRVEAVDVTGPRLAARRTADGAISALGLRMRPPGTTGPAMRVSAPTSAAAALGSSASPASPSPQAAQSLPLQKFELGRLTWKGVEVLLADHSVTPATTVRIDKAGVELANIVIDIGPRAGDAAPGQVLARIVAPGVADELIIRGTVAPSAGAITADLNITGKGLRGDLLAPYLKTVGIEPALRNGSLRLRTRVSLARKSSDMIAGSLAVESLRYADGGQELAGLDRLMIDEVALTSQCVAATSVLIDRPRALVRRNADGSLTMGGLRFNVPSTNPAPAEPSASAAAARLPTSAPLTTAARRPFVAKLGKLRINGGLLAWTDRAVTPAVNTKGHANVDVDGLVMGRDWASASVKIDASLDETLERFSAAGMASTSTTSSMLRLNVTASGLREGVLVSYMPPGTNITLKDGRFRATLEGGVAPHPRGGRSAKLIVSGADYRDGEATEPLLSFDSARVLLSRADVPGDVIAIGEISLAGLQTGARKAADSSMHALGLRFTSTAPAQARSASPGAAKPFPRSAASASGAPPARPAGGANVDALIAAGREKLPLITLDTLAVNLRRVSFVDESRPQASPIALADMELRNKAPIELLGSEPQSRPPVDLELVGKVDPVVGRFSLATQIAPFASQPTLKMAVTAGGIRGAGVTEIMPELRERIDGAALKDGRFTASLEASAKLAKRGPIGFDFSKPMGLNVAVREMAFRADGSDNSLVLAGVQEMRADGVQLHPATGSVIVRSVEISRPVLNARRSADGIHALGLVIKTPAARPAESSAGAAGPSSRPDGDAPTAKRTISGGANAPPMGAQAERTIERLTVSGIDVTLEDRSVNPPLIVPLTSFEVDIRGLSNKAQRERRPIRFNMTVGAGKVPLAASTQPGEMFSEIAASGNLTMYPSLRGRAWASVSGLEMLSLRGPAAASKVAIASGVFDGRIDLRFQDDGSLDMRSQSEFTDLRMSEPVDGVIRSTLKLPGPLDAMIIVLEDASGAITVPLNVTVEEGNVGSGQIAGAAVSALGRILGKAIASAPLKVAGGVTQMVGIDKAIPIFGRRKKQMGPQAAGALDFYAGTTDASAALSTAVFKELIERMREDETLEVTLRHELGGGDIARAAQRANPSPDAAAAMGAYLRQRRASLLQKRGQLAPAVRTMIVADAAGVAAEAITELRELEAQLAVTEDALDRAYDLIRPGAHRQAKRRTRAAGIEIAQARLDAAKRLLVAAGIPDAENRVRIIKPRFTPATGNAGGKVVMVVTSKKKP